MGTIGGFLEAGYMISSIDFVITSDRIHTPSVITMAIRLVLWQLLCSP